MSYMYGEKEGFLLFARQIVVNSRKRRVAFYHAFALSVLSLEFDRFRPLAINVRDYGGNRKGDKDGRRSDSPELGLCSWSFS